MNAPLTPYKAPETGLSGYNVLLMGPAGTGKTRSIATLVEEGVEVFYLALENGAESLLGYWRDEGKEVPANLHWHRLAAPQASFTEFIDAAKKINTLSFESITKLQDTNRGKYNQFISLLEALNNFPDDRTGQKFGPVNTWGVDRALVIDGLTGLGLAAMSMVIGGKPVKNQADWGIAQDQTEKLVRMLCDACPCHFILLAHVERETDQILGGVKLMVSTLGRALAPKFPSMFSDVILATRQGTKWTWDTAALTADLKTRNLEFRSDHEPTFKKIHQTWKARASV